MSHEDRLLLGVIAGPKGIKGEVRVKSFTEVPEDIAAYGALTDATGQKTFKLKVIGLSKGLPVVRIKGISDRNQAEALKGTELFVLRSELPEVDVEDEFYYADLVGLQAVFKEGESFGIISGVHDFGAGDMLEIIPDGKTEKSSVLVPFTAEMVPEVNMAAKQVVLDLGDDFFEVPKESQDHEQT
jgi:16S rRNA processing protein RimM